MQVQNEMALGSCQQCQPFPAPNYTTFTANHTHHLPSKVGSDELDILELVSDIPAHNSTKDSPLLAYQPFFDSLHSNPQYTQLAAETTTPISPPRPASKPKRARGEKRKRSRFAQPENWPKNVSKRKRMLGEEYVSLARLKDGTLRKVTREKREMGPRCQSKFCERSAYRFCSTFEEEARQELFQKFWHMTWEEKKQFVLDSSVFTERKQPYRKKGEERPSRRSGSYQYYLPIRSKVYQVCKMTFLNTLGIKEKTVHNWSRDRIQLVFPKKVRKKNCESEDQETVKESPSIKETSKEPSEAKETPKKPSKDIDSFPLAKLSKNDFLSRFLDDLPKIQTYYSRKQIDTVYLEQDFRSKSEVYSFYKEKCAKMSVTPFSIYGFIKQFDDRNLALFKPRKDQCEVCSAYMTKQVDEAAYQRHITARDLARTEKTADKLTAERNEIYCFDMELQSVKLCPEVQSSINSESEFKPRLLVYNFTICNLASNDCMNYIWNETEAELNSSVFTSFIIKYLKSVLDKSVKPIVLYSDSSGYRNKNLILSNALSMLALKYGTEIEQKYLEKGHTIMECDSAHALIDRRLKGKDIFLPTDYIGVVKEARKKPKPLDVEYVDHTFFRNYDELRIMRYYSINPGMKAKRKVYKVADLSCLKYKSDGAVFYKENYGESYKVLDSKQNADLDLNFLPGDLYFGRLKIWKRKWMHLQEMKKVLPMDIRYFYDSILFKEDKVNSGSKVKSKKMVKEKMEKKNK